MAEGAPSEADGPDGNSGDSHGKSSVHGVQYSPDPVSTKPRATLVALGVTLRRTPPAQAGLRPVERLAVFRRDG
jgi:hypothetical protein